MTLTVIGAAGIMQILKKWKVNYAYVLEIRPEMHSSYTSVYICGFICAVVFSICLVLQLLGF